MSSCVDNVVIKINDVITKGVIPMKYGFQMKAAFIVDLEHLAPVRHAVRHVLSLIGPIVQGLFQREMREVNYQAAQPRGVADSLTQPNTASNPRNTKT